MQQHFHLGVSSGSQNSVHHKRDAQLTSWTPAGRIGVTSVVALLQNSCIKALQLAISSLWAAGESCWTMWPPPTLRLTTRCMLWVRTRIDVEFQPVCGGVQLQGKTFGLGGLGRIAQISTVKSAHPSCYWPPTDLFSISLNIQCIA